MLQVFSPRNIYSHCKFGFTLFCILSSLCHLDNDILLYGSLTAATKTSVYPSIGKLKNYILRAVLIGLLPGRQNVSCDSILILILFRTVILQYRIESMCIIFYDNRKSGGTDNNQRKALKSGICLANQRCSLKKNGIQRRSYRCRNYMQGRIHLTCKKKKSDGIYLDMCIAWELELAQMLLVNQKNNPYDALFPCEICN